jgi:hypothetical protein
VISFGAFFLMDEQSRRKFMGNQDKGKERGSQKKAPKHTLMEKRKLKEEKRQRKQS